MKNFRYDINALRAIAVLSVLFFHFKVPYFSGGFTGVDVFFVISGYLMSKIIINDIDNNKFSILEFYGKRLKRIVPALLALILLITVAGFFFYLPNEYKINEKNATSSLLFYSNILYWKNSGYFDSASDNNIFLHTWSLSVEWQFYIIFPLILLAFKQLFKKKVYLILCIGSVSLGLFLFSIFLTNRSPVASFYLLPTRAWEMLAGCLAFLYGVRFIVQKKWILISGYGLIFLSVFFLDNSLSWPGLCTLMPVLGTFLVIISNQNESKILQNSLVQFTGKISYSLYLWHWPIFVFAQYMGLHISIISIAMLFLFALIMAYGSYRFIESAAIKKSLPILIVGSVLAFGTICLSYFNTNGKLFKKETLEIAGYEKGHGNEIQNQFGGGTCFFDNNNIKLSDFNEKICLAIDTTKKNFLLLGDSHGADLSASFREALEKKNINFMQATLAGRLPFLPLNEYKNELFKYIFYDFIVKNKNKINGIILAGNWSSAHTLNWLEGYLMEVLKYLKSQNLPVIIVGQSNSYTIPFASIAAKNFEYNTDISNFYLNKKSKLVNNFLQTKLDSLYLDIYYDNITPKLSQDLIPYMYDKDHFTKYGADLVVKKIITSVKGNNFFGK